MAKIYISGPMSGYPEYNYAAFNTEAKRLRERGYTVLNPAELPEQDSWENYMREGIKMLMDANEVVMLPDWRPSTGATIEHDLAKSLGMKIRYKSRAVVEHV